MKKCVIIGSGLGGLSCACILAKNGYEVTVLEQGEKIGGCLQCFKRGDALFDTGMHYIGSAEPGQTLHTMLRYLGLDSKNLLSRLDPKGYDIVSINGEQYPLANGREPFVDALAERFPGSREELFRYHDLVKKVAEASAMHSLKRDIDLNVNAEYQMRNVNEVIDSIISDPLLRQVLAGIQPLYAGEKDHTPFSTHALISDFYNQSAFRIIGGSSRIADALEATIRRFGGKVFVSQQVTKIECDDSRATAVVTAQGERFAADLIVSAIHPARTLDLLDTKLIRPAFRKRIKNARNTIAAFTVYLKFKKNRVPYLNRNVYYYRSKDVWHCQDYNDTTWPKYLLYMHFCHEHNPRYAETGEIITYMNIHELDQWMGTRVGSRGEDYEAFKRKKAETVIDALEEVVPGIRNDIESYFTSTPLTYLDYTGNPEGSMYGIAKDVDNIGSGTLSCRTSIPNLLMTGQSITLHGMMGVLSGSLLTCAEVLTRDEIFAQLKQYE